MSVYEKGLITVIAVACVFIGIALPLMLRKVPRNVVYGFRTRATLASDEVWYDVNAHFGRGMLVANVASIAAMLVLYRFHIEPQTYFNLSIVVLMVPTAVATLRSFRYLRHRRH